MKLFTVFVTMSGLISVYRGYRVRQVSQMA